MIAMTDASRAATAPTGRPPSELRWVSHPVLAAGAGPKNALLIAVVALAAFAVQELTASAGWALISAALLTLGVHDYLLPTTFTLNADSVRSASPIFRRNKPWSGLKSYQADRHGVLLSPFPHRSRLEAYRGLYVRFAGNRESVLAFVRRKLPAATARAGK